MGSEMCIRDRILTLASPNSLYNKMGRNKKYRGRFKRKNKNKNSNQRGNYDSVRKFFGRKKQIFAFYNKVLENTFANENEVKLFNESLRKSLPIAFRINKSGSNYSRVMQMILDQQEKGTQGLEKFLEQYELIEPKMFDLKQVSWFPGKSVWVMDATRNMLKKCPAMKVLHTQIQKGSEGGLLTRQELVSMLPPLFMDIQPDDKVLDMCAAPGSKTSQLLENLLMGCVTNQKGSSFEDRLKALGHSKGAIIANEIETKRAFILSHQMKRFNSSNVAVVNHPGQGIPTLRMAGEDKTQKFFFDKVLVDVPCSGDGAIRKIPMKWRNWSAMDGINLHFLQIQLLEKALDLVKVGGIIVYSTCSLNPIENEAVVAEVFRRANSKCSGALELEDVHSKFEGLLMRKGMTKWDVLIEKSKKEQNLLGKSGDLEKKEEKKEEVQEKKIEFNKLTFPDLERYVYINGKPKEKEFDTIPYENHFNCYSSMEEYLEAYKNKNPSNKIKPSIFFQNEDELRDQIQIEKTGRIHPHDQNTGGFYLALIRKKKRVVLTEVAKESEKTEKKPEETKTEKIEEEIKETKEEIKESKEETNKDSKPKNKPVGFENQKNVLKERDLMNFNPIAESEWEYIQKEFQLSEDFPRHLLVNSSNKQARRVNFINQGLYDMLSVPGNSKLRKIFFGVPVFTRNYGSSSKLKISFRLSYAGLSLIYPYLKKNVIEITFDEFCFFLQRKSSMSFETLKQKESLWKKVENLAETSFCLKMQLPTLNEEESGVEFLVLLKMAKSIGIMVSREQLDALRTKYGISMIEQIEKKVEKKVEKVEDTKTKTEE